MDTAKTWYHWLHVPSGKRGSTPFCTDDSGPFSELDMLRLINQWNAQQPGVWTYWL
jgi:hypothetical protein